MSPNRRSRRPRARLQGLAFLLGSAVCLSGALAQTEIPVPATTGDQLLFFYDARAGRTPFFALSNPSSAPVVVELAFYPASLASRLGDAVYTIPARGNLVVDPAGESALGAAGNLGLAVATPVQSAQSRTPLVPPRPLAGSFTLANQQLQAAFGENAFGRLAVDAAGRRAAAGAVVDGTVVRYQKLTPSRLLVPGYFSPGSLASPDQDGNRLVLALFRDVYGPGRFDLAGGDGSVTARFASASGTTLAESIRPLAGVLATHLQELAGEAVSLTGSGKVFLDLARGDASAFGVFSQSLGTFASGQRLPAVGSGPPGPTPTASPVVSPSPTPGAGCGETTVELRLTRAATSTSALAGVVARLVYPVAALVIPGTADDASVKERVTDATGLAAAGALFDVTDSDQSGDAVDDRLNVGLFSAAAPIPAGAFARVRFDCLAGASRPTAAAFACTVQASDADGGVVAGVGCSVAVLP